MHLTAVVKDTGVGLDEIVERSKLEVARMVDAVTGLVRHRPDDGSIH